MSADGLTRSPCAARDAPGSPGFPRRLFIRSRMNVFTGWSGHGGLKLIISIINRKRRLGPRTFEHLLQRGLISNQQDRRSRGKSHGGGLGSAALQHLVDMHVRTRGSWSGPDIILLIRKKTL